MKIGDMVKISGPTHGNVWEWTGTIVDIEESTDLFSEKYAIMETNTYVHALCAGEIKVFDVAEYKFEVI
jgi:hypothetical protein